MVAVDPSDGSPCDPAALTTEIVSVVAYEPPSRFVDGGTIFFIRK